MSFFKFLHIRFLLHRCLYTIAHNEYITTTLAVISSIPMLPFFLISLLLNPQYSPIFNIQPKYSSSLILSNQDILITLKYRYYFNITYLIRNFLLQEFNEGNSMNTISIKAIAQFENSKMKFFASAQHFQYFSLSLLQGFGPFGRLQPPANSKFIGAVQRLVEIESAAVQLKFSHKIIG